MNRFIDGFINIFNNKLLFRPKKRIPNVFVFINDVQSLFSLLELACKALINKQINSRNQYANFKIII